MPHTQKHSAIREDCELHAVDHRQISCIAHVAAARPDESDGGSDTACVRIQTLTITPGVTMSSTQSGTEQARKVPNANRNQKLEVVIVPVSDVDRAKRFYEGLGWRLDGDFNDGKDWRGVQMTPPGSPCSILFGKNFTAAQPGSLRGNFLVVEDVDAARADLIARGAEVSDVFHFEGVLQVIDTKGRAPGRDPEGRSYFSWASFSDPDGNTWMLQEIKSRLPGRGLSNLDVATLTPLLRETEEHHGQYEPTAPKHHWSDWYAAYIVARQQGSTPEEAAKAGKLRIEGAAEKATV
jgi:catechol 2,3-dioxygenase-like lactoylglutathione lyase family enzyme